MSYLLKTPNNEYLRLSYNAVRDCMVPTLIPQRFMNVFTYAAEWRTKSQAQKALQRFAPTFPSLTVVQEQ